MLALIAAIGLFKVSLGAVCKGAYIETDDGGKIPILPFDVCVNGVQSGIDVSIKYACDGSVPYQKGYAGHGCSGDTIINQAFDLDGAAAECSGTTCSYAVFRTYEATDCSQSGDYIEAPIITNECLQVNSTHSGEISCSETNIRTTIYGDTTCGTELRTEKMFETGCDADDNTYGEVLECAGCKIKIYTVFTAIFAALYSLF
mmetsp:Transcript_63928/g.57526  ORF Transcript_63928/g.57526 Transcript_63928/m.57526 type:complete len:202 (-) Transcript_63928:55-660(-)